MDELIALLEPTGIPVIDLSVTDVQAVNFGGHSGVRALLGQHPGGFVLLAPPEAEPDGRLTLSWTVRAGVVAPTTAQALAHAAAVTAALEGPPWQRHMRRVGAPQVAEERGVGTHVALEFHS